MPSMCDSKAVDKLYSLVIVRFFDSKYHSVESTV